MFAVFLYLLTTFLPLAHTLPPDPRSLVNCGILPAQPINIGHCIILLTYMDSLPTTFERITYGRMQPLPGKIPQTYTYGTCIIQLDALAFQPIRATDTFRLSDFMERIRWIESDCLSPEHGYRVGTVVVGGRNRFFAWLGGRPIGVALRGNATLRGEVLNE